MTPTEKHLETGLMLWIECLRDGTPDAGNIIATALAKAEREGMRRAAEIARNEAERSTNSVFIPVVANIVADRILSEANSHSPDTLPVEADKATGAKSSSAPVAAYSPWTVKNGRRV